MAVACASSRDLPVPGSADRESLPPGPPRSPARARECPMRGLTFPFFGGGCDMEHVLWAGLPGRLLRVGLVAFGLLLVTGPLVGQRQGDEARPPDEGKRADRKAPPKAYLGA